MPNTFNDQLMSNNLIKLGRNSTIDTWNYSFTGNEAKMIGSNVFLMHHNSPGDEDFLVKT